MTINPQPSTASPWPIAVLAKTMTGAAAGLSAVALARLMPVALPYSLALAMSGILAAAICDAMLPGWLWVPGPTGSSGLRVRWIALRAALTWQLVAILLPVTVFMLSGRRAEPLYAIPLLMSAVAGFGAAWAHRHDPFFDGRRPSLRVLVAVAAFGGVAVWLTILTLLLLGVLDPPLNVSGVAWWPDIPIGVAIVAGSGLLLDIVSARYAAKAGYILPPAGALLGRTIPACGVLLLLPALILIP